MKCYIKQTKHLDVLRAGEWWRRLYKEAFSGTWGLDLKFLQDC